MSNEELVTVMVPKRHLAKVYGFIARLDESVPSSGDSDSSFMDAKIERILGPARDFAGDNAGDGWTDSLVQRAVKESPRAMKGILRAMAERPGEWISTSDLASAISHKPDADWKTVAGTLGAFRRRVKNRYKLETLPYDGMWDHTEHCKMHRMSAEMATRVLAALSNGKHRN